MSWKRQALEEACKGIARSLVGIVERVGKEMVPPRNIGFALVLFDLGSGGDMSYMSNGKREDMIKCLQELLGHLEQGDKAN